MTLRGQQVGKALIAAMALALLSSCALLGKTEQNAYKSSAPRFALRVNCGADETYVDQAGNKWLPDQMMETHAMWGAVGGGHVTRERDIENSISATAPSIYRTERYSLSAYEFSLPEGRYTVRLHFAETYDAIQAPGERVFSVSIAGESILEDFDVFKRAGGAFKPVMIEQRGVEVDKENLVIRFESGIQNPEINGIEICSE